MLAARRERAQRPAARAGGRFGSLAAVYVFAAGRGLRDHRQFQQDTSSAARGRSFLPRPAACRSISGQATRAGRAFPQATPRPPWRSALRWRCFSRGCAGCSSASASGSRRAASSSGRTIRPTCSPACLLGGGHGMAHGARARATPPDLSDFDADGQPRAPQAARPAVCSELDAMPIRRRSSRPRRRLRPASMPSACR